MKSPALVEVTWYDAVTHSKGWTGLKKAAKESVLDECRTVGHLVRKDRKKIVVALTYGKHKKNEEVNQTIAIPRSWVLSLTYLRK